MPTEEIFERIRRELMEELREEEFEEPDYEDYIDMNQEDAEKEIEEFDDDPYRYLDY